MIEEENELGDSRFFVYDIAGNLTQKTDRNERVTQYTYDKLNRRTAEKWMSGASPVRTIAYSYDAAGQLTSAADSDSAYAYGYDALGRTVTVDNRGTPNAPQVALTNLYDALGSRTQVSAIVGGTLDYRNDYSYDALRRQTLVTQQGQTGNTVAPKHVSFEYNAAGQTTLVYRSAQLGGFPATAISTYEYDPAGRLAVLTHERIGTIHEMFFTYDAANRITQFYSGTDGASDYSYDERGQLTAAVHESQDNEDYDYDDNGNRESAGGVDYDHTENNQLTDDGTYTYEYDDEGNRFKRIAADGSYTKYEWDYRNRLTQITERTVAGAILKQFDYTYDVNNLRIAKSVDNDGAGAGAAVVTRFVLDGQHIALQFAGSNALTHRYLHGPAIDQILADEDASGNVLWPLADHLGSVRDIVNSSGVVQNHIVYDAFGKVTSETNSSVDHLFGYTGRERDEESGLNYHRGRYYEPPTGRWISEDPIGFAASDSNLSRYVTNAPTNSTDPSGLIDWWRVLDRGLLIVQVPAEFMTGVGDSLSMGTTEIVREALWGEELSQIQYKAVYRAGEWTEVAVEVGITGGSALMKRAAAKQIAKEAAEIAARSAGSEITEQAAKRAVRLAETRLAAGLRREARQIVGATKDELVHHIHPLVGHPPFAGRGPMRTAFPTIGIEWLANSRLNLMRIAKNEPGVHVWLHQRAYIAERVVVTLTHPGATAARTVLNWQRDNQADIKVELNCKR